MWPHRTGSHRMRAATLWPCCTARSACLTAAPADRSNVGDTGQQHGDARNTGWDESKQGHSYDAGRGSAPAGRHSDRHIGPSYGHDVNDQQWRGAAGSGGSDAAESRNLLDRIGSAVRSGFAAIGAKLFTDKTPPLEFYSKSEPYYEFTNFFVCNVSIDNAVWPTTEHYFQAMKFLGDTKTVQQVRQLPTPRDAFDFSRRHANRWTCSPERWNCEKDGFMLRALRCKFTQIPHLRQLLLDTGTRKLVEHTQEDRYWGDGGDGSGQNRLGELLMCVRAELREQSGTAKSTASSHALLPVTDALPCICGGVPRVVLLEPPKPASSSRPAEGGGGTRSDAIAAFASPEFSRTESTDSTAKILAPLLTYTRSLADFERRLMAREQALANAPAQWDCASMPSIAAQLPPMPDLSAVQHSLRGWAIMLSAWEQQLKERERDQRRV